MIPFRTYYPVEQLMFIYEELSYPVHYCLISEQTRLSFIAQRVNVPLPHWQFTVSSSVSSSPVFPNSLTWARHRILILFPLGIVPLDLPGWARTLSFLISFSTYFRTIGPPYLQVPPRGDRKHSGKTNSRNF